MLQVLHVKAAQKKLKQYTETKMNLLDTLLMLLRWKRDGWEVHPVIDDFQNWV